MPNGENTTTQPKISIAAGGENYHINLPPLAEFIEQTQKLDFIKEYDMEHGLTLMRRYILLGLKYGGEGAAEMADVLLFIDDLTFLFDELYHKTN